jgi:Fe-S cluster assembly protein SufD
VADQFGPRAGLVVLVDGRVVAAEATDGRWAEGLSVVSLADQRTSVDALGSIVAPDDAFGYLHDAFVVDGVVVQVAPGSVVAEPIVVVHVVTNATTAAEGSRPAVFPHTLVQVGRGADVAVVEVAVSAPGAGGALTVPVTELEVAEDARLRHATVQSLGDDVWQVATVASRVGRGGELASLAVAFGGHYARLRTDAQAAGSGASCTLLAAFLATGEQVFDFRTRQDHLADHSRSELLFKGAVADHARSVYSGLIHMARGARGADARQTNHNLVLSEGARADSVPNLDIEENDVRCSHGSTVGPIDAMQRHYLESRGIEPAIAERMVVAGFFADLVGRSPVPAVGAWAERHVEGRLAARAAVGGGGLAGAGGLDGTGLAGAGSGGAGLGGAGGVASVADAAGSGGRDG